MDNKREVQNTPKKKRIARPLILILSVILLAGSVLYGTMAWLASDTEPVINTFSYGNIRLKLEESKVDADGNPTGEKTTTGNEYKLSPGKVYLKDPTVTVFGGSEECWLFVKMEEDGGVTVQNPDGSKTSYTFADYLTYALADGWTQLKTAAGAAVPGVYFRYVAEDAADQNFSVLKNDQISVVDTADEDQINALDNNGQDTATANYPSLSVTAYTIQHFGFEPQVSPGETGPTAQQTNAAALNAWQVLGA